MAYELNELVEMLKSKGYEIEWNVTRRLGDVEIFANAVAKTKGFRYVSVRREENCRPLIPLERFSVAVARLLGVKGFAVTSNGEDVMCLRVDNGKNVSLEDIPDANEAQPLDFNFDEERESRIAVAIGKLRCPCKQGECRI
ncbi:MAG: hypothetical protein DSY33_00375 [Archaeoglobus sp.]|jgi:hypothetical protein|nr:MAG: hypothetical protein DSY33_00375 [Archaeoglobus sp.]